MSLRVGSVVRLNSTDEDGPRLTVESFSEHKVWVAYQDPKGLHLKELRREMLTETGAPLPKCAICGSPIVDGACAAWGAGKDGCPAAAAYREHEEKAKAATPAAEETGQ